MQNIINKKILIFLSLLSLSLYYSFLYFNPNYNTFVLFLSIFANFILLFSISNSPRLNKYNFLFLISSISFLILTFYFSINSAYEILRFIFFLFTFYTYSNISKKNFENYYKSVEIFFYFFFPIIFFLFILTFFSNVPRTSIYFDNIAYLSVFFFFSFNYFLINKRKLLILFSLIGILLTFTKSTLLAAFFLIISQLKNSYLRLFLSIFFVLLTFVFIYEEFYNLSIFSSKYFEPFRLFTGFNRRDDYWLFAIEQMSIEPQGINGIRSIISSLAFYNTSLHSVWFDNIIIYGYLNFSIYFLLLIKLFKFNTLNFPYFIIMSFLTMTPGGIGLFPHLFLFFMTLNNSNLKIRNDN